MRLPETTRAERQTNQLARRIQEKAQLTGVNVSGTQISSQALEMVTDVEPSAKSHRRACKRC